MDQHAPTEKPFEARDDARDRSFSKKLTASISVIGSLVGVATLICWLIGDAYSQLVLRSFSIAPQLLDRSIQTVALSGVQVLFSWIADGVWTASLTMLLVVFVLVLARLAGRLSRPALMLVPLGTRANWKEKWDSVQIPLPPLPAIGVALSLGGLLAFLGLAHSIGRAEAVKTISAIREADAACAKGLCPVYRTNASAISGVLVTADKDRMFISTGKGIVAVEVAALREVSTPVVIEPAVQPDGRVMPSEPMVVDRPRPSSPNPAH